jgi:Ala-tRNA(Pro) deacylase
MIHTKQELLDQLSSLSLPYKLHKHEPLFTVEQAQKIYDTIPGAHVKNLFLKDDNGKLWLIVAQTNTKIELKKVAQLCNAPKLRFADEQLLMQYLGVKPGSVTPFALLNDTDHKVQLVLDATLFDHDIINAHPLENDATISVSQSDFKKLLIYSKHVPIIINFNEYKIINSFE